MVGQLNPGLWVLGFNHHGKKGSKMVVMMDLDRTYSPQQQALALLSVSMDNIMSFNIDVGVTINDLITSGEEGVENSSKSSTIVM